MPFEKIIILKGDITEMDCEAIVNAANTELWLGGGVAGAILKKGGKSIEEDAIKQGPVELGEAVITRGGNLRAAYVIHAASIEPGKSATVESVKKATYNALELAKEKGIRTIAFPALGCGVGGLSYAHCARAMLSSTLQFLETEENPRNIYFVLCDDEALKSFRESLESFK